MPRLTKVAVLFDPGDKRAVGANAFTTLAEKHGVKTRDFHLTDVGKVADVLAALKRYRPDMLVVAVSPLTLMVRDRLCRFAILQRIPLVSEGIIMAKAGALLTYGPDEIELTRQLAVYVDKIVRGSKAA